MVGEFTLTYGGVCQDPGNGIREMGYGTRAECRRRSGEGDSNCSVRGGSVTRVQQD